MQSAIVFALVLGLSSCRTAAADEDQKSPLPMIIEMLKIMKDRAAEVGKGEAVEYKKYQQWCHDTERQLKYEIKDEKGDIEDFDATLAKAASDLSVAQSKIEEQASSLSESESSLKEAQGVRKKEKEEFKSSEKSLTDSMNALDRASNVLSKKAASFVQTPVDQKEIKVLLSTINSVISAASLGLHNQKKLAALVQGSEAEDSESDDELGELGAPTAAKFKSNTGGITEMLEDMKAKAVAQLKELRTEDRTAGQNADLLMGSLTAQIKVAEGEIAEAKETKNTATSLQAQTETEKAVSVKELNADVKALRDALSDCRIAGEEFEESKKGREEEIAAVDAGIAALGGVKNKEAGYSFLQIQAGPAEVVNILRNLAQKQHSAVLTQLVGRVSAAMTVASGDASSADPFKKVKGLISGMVDKLVKEAEGEASHKKYCDKAIAESKESKAKLQFVMDKQTGQIDKAKAKAASLEEQTATLTQDLATLSKEQGEADKNRASENALYKTTKADLKDAAAGVKAALKVLRAYYDSKAAEFFQKPSFGHKKESGAGGSVISILEMVEADTEKQLSKTEMVESEAITAYTGLTNDNKFTKAVKSETLKHKKVASITLAKVMSEYNEDLEGQQTEMDAILAAAKGIKGQCDAPEPESYEEKVRRRTSEIEGLKEALKVIEGRAFLQTAARQLRGVAAH